MNKIELLNRWSGSSPFGRGRIGGGWERNELLMSSVFNRAESKKRRRYLRKNMTRAEKLLWGKLRKSQLSGLRFRRQYGVLNYVLDFYCPEYKLGIEIIGDVHGYRCRREFDLRRQRKIESLVKKYSLEQRVVLAGHVTEQELLDLYARCRAVYYAPVNEDFGLVTVEAFTCRKPVLTATDSGGPTELVHHGENGFVLPPDPATLAEKITMLMEDTASAERMGQNGYDTCSTITWPEAVRRLLA